MRNSVKVILLLILIMFFLGLLSCQRDICKLPNGEKTTELLASVAYSRNYNYCELLKKSLHGDSSAIRSFALLKFSDAAAYDHGAVLIEVVLKVGEKRFLNAVINTTKEDRKRINSYLAAGLLYGYRKEYENSRLEEVFPDIHDFLKT